MAGGIEMNHVPDIQGPSTFTAAFDKLIATTKRKEARTMHQQRRSYVSDRGQYAPIATLVKRHREELDLTQDEYGAKFGISGPAVFKIEHGFIRPSFYLWINIAKALKLTEQKAVVLWSACSLPKKYQKYILK